MLTILKRILDDLVVSLLTCLSGSTGIKLRYLYYKKKFNACGKNVVIDQGVIILNPKFISIGSDVWIDKYSVLIAGKTELKDCAVKKILNINYDLSEGELSIGSGVHIGNFNVIQAHAGVKIGNFVTTSPGVKIYSLSNYPINEEKPEEITYANCMVGNDKTVSYVYSPVVIEDGAWLALNSSVIGSTIGKNSFVASNSIVMKDLPANSYASGSPAVKIKERFKEK